MKYGLRPISELSNPELIEASFQLAHMRTNHENAANDPRYEERFKNQPEREINPNFVNLENAIETEIENRKLIK